jgi:GT2 family glycosyltransferase
MISIIIVGFNNKADLKDCFASIFQSRFKDFKVIYVDNASSDGSLGFIKKNFPQVITIANQNTGYAGGNNVGIKKALELGSSHVFIINPDTILEPDCLSNLMKNKSSNQITQPLILLHENGKKTDLVNTTGNHLNFLGISYCNDYRKNKKEIKSKSITAASGAAMLIPASIINKIGYFDERFFMYHEDLDLSWRARMAGFNVYLDTSAIIYHKYHFSKNKGKFYYIERNRWYFIYKNYALKTILLISPLLAINEVLMILYSLFSLWPLIKLRANLAFILNLPSILQSRKKSIRKVKDRSLKEFMSTEISFSEVKVPMLNYYEKICGGYFKLIKRFI